MCEVVSHHSFDFFISLMNDEHSCAYLPCLSIYLSILPVYLSIYVGCPVAKWSEVKGAQSCLTLCDPLDYTVPWNSPGRILEWIPVPFCRGSSQPMDQIQVSHITGGFFTRWVTREAQILSLRIILFKYQGNYNSRIPLLNSEGKEKLPPGSDMAFSLTFY